MAPRSTTDDLHWWNEILALAYIFFIMPWCLYGNVRVVDSSDDISRKSEFKLCFNVGLINWIYLVGTWLIPNTQLPWLDWESTGTKWFLPSVASCQQPCSTVPRIRVLKESPFRTWHASGRLCPIKLLSANSSVHLVRHSVSAAALLLVRAYLIQSLLPNINLRVSPVDQQVWKCRFTSLRIELLHISTSSHFLCTQTQTLKPDFFAVVVFLAYIPFGNEAWTHFATRFLHTWSTAYPRNTLPKQ